MTLATFSRSDCELVTTKKQLATWKRLVTAARSFAYDTETTGLDVHTVDLVGHALAVEDDGKILSCYIPTGHKGVSKQLTDADVFDAIGDHLASTMKPVILSNAPYDMMVLKQTRYAQELGNVHDIVRMSYALTGDLHERHGMDFLAQHYLGYEPIHFHEVVNARMGIPDFSYVDLHTATVYSAEDAGITLLLAKVLQSLLKREGLWDVYDKIDRPMLPTLTRMMHEGVTIDVKHCEALASSWGTEMEKKKKDLRRIAGWDVMPNSNDEVARVIFEERGLEPLEFGKAGKPSVDKATLEAHEGDEFCDVLREYRALAKLRSTYAVALPKKVHPVTGRVHTRLKDTRTSTGRLASADPNLQNIPTRTREGAELRAAFIARPKRTLVVCDYSQIEMRVAAHRSREPVLLKAFREGIDVHTQTAATIRHCAIEDVTKTDRGYAKTTNFLALYGGGAGQLSTQVKIPVSEAYVFLDEYWEAMSALADYRDDVHAFGRHHGYSMTMFGRRCYCPDAQSRNRTRRGSGERLAFSGAIQGSAADLMRLALPASEKAARGVDASARLALTVHDELMVDADERKGERVLKATIAAMETCADRLVDWAVPIIAEGNMGKDWRAAK